MSKLLETIRQKKQLWIISGPCVIESQDHTLECAKRLKEMCLELGVGLIFKASFDKANRSSFHSFRGPGLEKGLDILHAVKTSLSLPVTTDVHLPEQADAVAKVCDILQIPAFLCRQTDLIVAAAKTQVPINVKKGQFLAPWDMKNVVEKIREMGNSQIILTERGSSFGYNNLVCDMRSIPHMQSLGVPVCFDASHSTQLPGALGNITGGQRGMIPTLAKAAIAAGADMLFIESHPHPEKAKSDSTTVYPLDELPLLLKSLQKLFLTIHENES